VIRLVLSDVDGTLIRSDKSLSGRTIDAVEKLRDAEVHFAITSGRPPRGMEMLIEPLSLQTPLAAFNGGLIVEPSMEVLAEHTVPDEIVGRVVELLESFGLSIWVYRGSDWLVHDPDGPHVAKESTTVQFGPTVVHDFDGATHVTKIVGVSDDHDTVAELVGGGRGGGRNRVVVVTHTDDLGDVALEPVEALDDRRLELHGLRLAVDVRPVGIDDEPVRAAVEPGGELERLDQLDGPGDQAVRDDPLLDDA
jgi:hypothetical protein